MLAIVASAPMAPTLGRGISLTPRAPAPRRVLRRAPQASAQSTEVFQLAEKVAAKVGEVSAPGAPRRVSTVHFNAVPASWHNAGTDAGICAALQSGCYLLALLP